jgi:hypothetical protein
MGVVLAQRAGLTADEVLNTRDADDFAPLCALGSRRTGRAAQAVSSSRSA